MFLKDQLKECEYIDFKVVSWSPWQSFSKKDGGTYQAGELHLKVRATGEQTKEKIFNEKFYKGFTKDLAEGALVRAKLDGQFVNWEKLPMGEASSTVPHKSNTQEVKDERTFTANIVKETEKSIEIGLRGVAQALIIKGLTVDEALNEAERTHPLFAAAAKRLANGESPDTSVKPELNEAQKVFFADDTPTSLPQAA
jgi:hypothetical protein